MRKNFRKAFTLIELLVAISLLSIIMIFLYKSYSSLNISNTIFKEKLNHIKNEQIKKRVIFLDFSLALFASNTILNQNKKEDVVFFQSSNSIHDRDNPYIAYIVKNSKLYRLESLREFKDYPLNQASEFSIDDFGEVNSFRVYKSDGNTTSSSNSKELFLVHVDFKNGEDVLLKIKPLNEK
ncbi:prepilin-type N-terminal cleavage/methylation domain-containing protein [bacterium]|nr:prepilin-type N-terminal cleavage/methylation domain-containing protein [bacterium]MBU1994446.1 prepilin-type N-terminal cleavage/methylation domain-containing protein [bacterium]